MKSLLLVLAFAVSASAQSFVDAGGWPKGATAK
jgi:hypothetical protein